MKKISILLALILLLSCFAGCAPAADDPAESTGSGQQQESTGSNQQESTGTSATDGQESTGTNQQESTGTSATDSQESTGAPVDEPDDDIPEGVLALSGKGVSARKLAVKYMLDMANLKWSPDHDINFTEFGFDKLVYEAGKTYYGVVYNNNSTGFEKFCSVLDDNNTYLESNITWNDWNGWNESPGNSCATSIEHAWQQISPTVEYGYSKDMMPYYKETNVLGVGDIDWSTYNGKNTNTILKGNDRMVVMEAYALTHLGDGVVRYWDNGGHALMITKEPEVYRNEDGSVNPVKSFLYLTEQNNYLNLRREYPSSWGVDMKMSFTEVYNQGYLPVTIAELQSDVVPNATFDVENEPTAEALAQGSLSCTVESNYCMNVVKVEILSGDEVVASAEDYPYKKVFPCKKLGEAVGLDELAAGEYTLKITAEVGLGSITLVNISFTK
ncbi:MAG: hypothetical protein IJW94_00685 [Oscillospiraceae bacterium]|nr:hypothetical protein [Oscillospiraceae bacterium]